MSFKHHAPKHGALKMALATVGLSLLFANSAYAQSAGNWLVAAGYNKFTPHVSSGDITGVPGAKIDAGSASNALATIGYMFTDNISAEFFIGVPHRHTLYGAGVIAPVGKLGEVDLIPPTLFAQYHFFSASSPIRPVIGLGVSRAIFWKADSSPMLTAITAPTGPQTTFHIDSAWGLTPQIGLDFAITPNWSIELGVEKVFVTSTAHLSTGQSVKAQLNPTAINVRVGYRF